MRCSCSIALGISLASGGFAANSRAAASYTDSIVQSRATAFELSAHGHARVGQAPWISTATGACAPNGCFTYVGMAGVMPTKGFIEFQFSDYTCDTEFYSGLFAMMPINFAGTSLTAEGFIGVINEQASVTGVTAVRAADAAGCHGGLFLDWLPTALHDAIVFQWTPPAPPSGDGLSEVFRFAWNLGAIDATDTTPAIEGIYAVPTPGGLTLLLLLVGHPTTRRRRHAA